MTGFWQGSAAVLLAVILILALGKQGKEMGLLLSLAVCCMVGVLALSYLKPVVDMLEQLQEIAGIEPQMLRILLKAVGIGILGELAGLICTDAGNGALGKALQLLTGAVILWLSIPLIQALIELLSEMLGEV